MLAQSGIILARNLHSTSTRHRFRLKALSLWRETFIVQVCVRALIETGSKSSRTQVPVLCPHYLVRSSLDPFRAFSPVAMAAVESLRGGAAPSRAEFGAEGAYGPLQVVAYEEVEVEGSAVAVWDAMAELYKAHGNDPEHFIQLARFSRASWADEELLQRISSRLRSGGIKAVSQLGSMTED